MRFQSLSIGKSGYTGYVIIYIASHSDTCDTADSNVVSNNTVDDNKLVAAADSIQAEPHTPGAVEHTLAVPAHNKVCKQHNRKALKSLLRLLRFFSFFYLVGYILCCTCAFRVLILVTFATYCCGYGTLATRST